MNIGHNRKRRGRRVGSRNYQTYHGLPTGRVAAGIHIASPTILPALALMQLHPNAVVLEASRQHNNYFHPPPLEAVMLGAQARAAELQAAKSAAMRQKAHREAENLIIPPESAPVSLTDFVRNPVLNKNKGVKAFRPLIDADLEVVLSQADSPNSASESPLTDNTQLPMPGTTPVAPRAMLGRSNANISRSMTSRAQPISFIPQQNSAVRSMRETSGLEGCVSASPLAATAQNTFGYVFGPEDVSPIKQEVKFADILQNHSGFQPEQIPIYHYPTPFAPDARILTPQQNCHHETQTQFSGTQTQLSCEPCVCARPPLQHCQSENSTSATGHARGQIPVDRPQLFADELINHHRLQQHFLRREPLYTSLPIIDSNEPYDRHSKMQSFVAAQQAMARKGKTVLHNPDLHKSSKQCNMTTPQSQIIFPMSPFSLQNHPTTSMFEPEKQTQASGASQRIQLESKPSILRAVRRRDGSVLHAALDMCNVRIETKHDEEKTSESISNNAFPQGIMIEEWLSVRPVTTSEKEAMKRQLRKTASETTMSLSKQSSFADSAMIVGTKAQEWLKNGSATRSIKHALAEQVVDNHQNCANQSSAYGIIGRPVLREKMDLSSRGTLKAIAQIMATLYDFAEQRQKIPGFSEYTPTPKYAIDTSVNYKLSGISLLDSVGLSVVRP